jgi:peptide/nickel transport system substrate-binding protein
MKKQKAVKTITAKSALCVVLATLMLLMTLASCATSKDVAPSPAASEAGSNAPASEAPQESSAPAQPQNRTVVISLASGWSNLNVFDYGSDYGAYVKGQIFDKLVLLDRNGGINPSLLASWVLSDDGLTLTGKVNTAAKWQDGEPVTAEDVAFTYALFANPLVTTTARPLTVKGTDDTGVLADGETLGVTALDTETIEFKLKVRTPEILFFGDADKFYILPKHLLETADPATLIDNQFFAKPIGSGPFFFDSQIIGTEAVFLSNPDYFKGAPKFERLVVRVVTNDNLLSGLLSGDIDLTGGSGISALPYTDWQIAQGDGNLVTQSLPHLGTQLIIVNTARPAIADARVRQALEYAIDKQSLVDNLYGGEGVPLYSPIIPSNAYFNKSLRQNTYDPAKSKELLDEAGFDYGVELSIVVPSGVTERERAAVLVQQYLEAVGVKSKIELMEFASVGARLYDPDGYDFVFMGQTPTVAPNSFKGWFTAGPASFNGLTDPSIYDAYGNAEIAETDALAHQYYDEAQQLIQDQVPLIFLYSSNNLIAHTKRIGNIDYDNYFLTDNIYEWTVD